jgi:hypothetical protein
VVVGIDTPVAATATVADEAVAGVVFFSFFVFCFVFALQPPAVAFCSSVASTRFP